MFYSGNVLLGDVGSGQNAKLINNTLMAAHVAIAHHGLRMAESLSMSKSALAEIVSVSSGRSFGFDVYARQATPSDFKHGAKLLLKDISLLDASLAEKDDILPIRELTVPLMESIIKADQ